MLTTEADHHKRALSLTQSLIEQFELLPYENWNSRRAAMFVSHLHMSWVKSFCTQISLSVNPTTQIRRNETELDKAQV